MEGITLQLRLDGESAELFTNQLLAFAEKQVKEQLENDRMPINQQALMKKFGFTHAYVKKLERKGLRFRKQGKDIMYDVNDVYEILELLLTYVVVRKDCKGIAKELLGKYGDLYTLLKQPEDELKKNSFVTDRTVVFFKVIFQILEKELYKKIHNEKITISSNVQLLNYLEYSLLKRDIEVFKVLFLNTQNELLKEEELFKGTLDRSTVYIRELVKKILDYNAKSVIIVHNHPSGSLKPSQSDITLTQKLKDTFERIEIRLLDHLIISEKGYFSFLEGGLL